MKKEIIYTDDYALIVSDEKPIEGQYFLFTPYNSVFKTDSTEYGENAMNTHGVEYVESFTDDRQFNVEYCKTVIAHRPLTNAPILEGVLLLPPFSRCQEYGVENEVMEFKKVYGSLGATDYELSAFLKGYNKAKETYKYTEKDLAEAYERGMNNIDSDGCHIDQPADDFTEFIQSLQQPKRPKYFECEMEDTFLLKNRKGGNTIMAKPKAITNSEGQKELVGEYSYE